MEGLWIAVDDLYVGSKHYYLVLIHETLRAYTGRCAI